MTREEIVKLLKLFKATYPNTKPITDPESTIAAWELALGDEEAEKVYKASRVYIKMKGKFFPSPKDIYDLIGRGQLLYGTQEEAPKIEAPKNHIGPYCPSAREKLSDGTCACLWYDSDQCFGTEEEWKVCKL